jgi:exodeoxyribonuclease V alpha subunit
MTSGARPVVAAAPDLDIAPLQRHFIDLLLRLGNGRDPLLVELVQQLCAATAAGHACIDLNDVTPAPQVAERVLLDSGIVGRPGEFVPLVLDAAGRLYTWRYWHYEHALATSLIERARARDDDIDPARLHAPLQTLFPGEAGDLQRVAAAIAVMRRLCVLSGGPGTGKTTTIVRLLAMLVQWHAPASLRIALAAPTGKAAARMQEAVRAARETLPVDASVIDAIPSASQTLHRLLGARPGTNRFMHDRDRPLPVDVLVVDEASMVDLALMSRLVDALPRHARLILVGDRDQLASVEPGAVLGSLCAEGNAYTPRFAEALRIATGCEVPRAGVDERPFADACVLLSRSHRFAAGGAIANLARAIRDGDADEAMGLLGAGGDVQWRGEPAPQHDLRTVLAGPLGRYADAIARGDIAGAFANFEGFRVLTAVRDGPVGSNWLNELIESQLRRLLRDAGPVGGGGEWFAGRAVMINRNHRPTRLFNGDVALMLPGPEGLRAWLRGPGNDMRALSPARLPSHEPAYALTIHKSQGSEFDEVLVLLPNADSPVLTRELLYTALTRARRRLVLWGSEAAIRAAIARPTRRVSGLRDACWGQGQ